MKIVAIIVVIILLAIAGILLFSPKAPNDVQSLEVTATSTENQMAQEGIDAQGVVELTEFSFVGYGPGKSHTGDFKEYEVKNVKVNPDGVPVAGEFVIQTASITTDAEMLTNHLKDKEEFFNVTKYPTINFKLLNTTETAPGLYQVSGDLTMKDITKQVAFTTNANLDRTFSSEFKLKMSDFGFSAPGIVDDEVLIKFAGKVN